MRRRRYAGKNPREYHEKYKELDSARYPGEVEKVRGTAMFQQPEQVP